MCVPLQPASTHRTTIQLNSFSFPPSILIAERQSCVRDSHFSRLSALPDYVAPRRLSGKIGSLAAKLQTLDERMFWPCRWRRQVIRLRVQFVLPSRRRLFPHSHCCLCIGLYDSLNSVSGDVRYFINRPRVQVPMRSHRCLLRSIKFRQFSRCAPVFLVQCVVREFIAIFRTFSYVRFAQIAHIFEIP